jgi:hypothetical protein
LLQKVTVEYGCASGKIQPNDRRAMCSEKIRAGVCGSHERGPFKFERDLKGLKKYNNLRKIDPSEVLRERLPPKESEPASSNNWRCIGILLSRFWEHMFLFGQDTNATFWQTLIGRLSILKAMEIKASHRGTFEAADSISLIHQGVWFFPTLHNIQLSLFTLDSSPAGVFWMWSCESPWSATRSFDVIALLYFGGEVAGMAASAVHSNNTIDYIRQNGNIHWRSLLKTG